MGQADVCNALKENGNKWMSLKEITERVNKGRPSFELSSNTLNANLTRLVIRKEIRRRRAMKMIKKKVYYYVYKM